MVNKVPLEKLSVTTHSFSGGEKSKKIEKQPEIISTPL